MNREKKRGTQSEGERERRGIHGERKEKKDENMCLRR